MTKWPRVYWLLIFCGIAVRFWLWWNSFGSNDTHIWAMHGTYILQHGLVAAYRSIAIFNHPPLMGEWARFAVEKGQTLWRFSLWMRAPGLLADLVTIFLLTRFASPAAAALYACAPVAILIAAYHGNTDALCAAAIVGAAIALDRRRWFIAGLLLAIALNVKVIPLVLVPVVFLSVPDRRALLRLSGGLSLAVLPFLPPALSAAQAMRQNILGYVPSPSEWGVPALLFPVAQAWYTAHARVILIGAIMVLALVSRFRLRLAVSRQIAIALCLFLVLTPGFGMQYLIYPTSLLCLAAPSQAWPWIITSGIFAVTAYSIGLTGSWPLQTWMQPLAGPTESLGIIAWIVLIYFIAHTRRFQRVPSKIAQSDPF